MASTRVLQGVGGLVKHRGSKVVVDYVVKGGGFAGLNAVAGLARALPEANVLCASVLPPGGSWNLYYPHVKLHAAHPHFGVASHPWPIDDPHVLASREQVLQHFNSYVDTIPPNFDFAQNTAVVAVNSTREADGNNLFDVMLRDTLSGEEMNVVARHVIDATGANYDHHTRREEDFLFQSSDIPETETVDLHAVMASANPGRDRLYVVIGGGKTGLDNTAFIAQNRRATDDILLVTGRNKAYFRRDKIQPRKDAMSPFNPFQFAVADLMLDMVLNFDGNNGLDVVRAQQAAGMLHTVNGVPAQAFMLGALDNEERRIVEESTEVVVDDYFVGTQETEKKLNKAEEVEAGGGRASSSTTTTVLFQHREPLETDKEVVLVNCRTSASPESHYVDATHPVRPDGTLKFGASLGYVCAVFVLRYGAGTNFPPWQASCVGTRAHMVPPPFCVRTLHQTEVALAVR